MFGPRRRIVVAIPAVAALGAAALILSSPAVHADNDNNTLIPNNKRLNDGVIANVYTVQHQAGCTNDVRSNPQLQLAAQRHTEDVLNNRALDGDIGSDGSTPQDRASAAGFHAPVAETVAINPALAISGIELINQWYSNPSDFAIMSNCANSQIGVWSQNSLDRTVVVAVYGQPPASTNRTATEALPLGSRANNVPIDPSPDYDASDELEFGIGWLPWILRGVYPPPANPPQ
ncbi:CAP domain-containing protein [Mycobacterium intracellulare]|uniref:CAP domain-containing protein n=1 Tax=Mycobacterium intracellulare TaxID=1767 RepID=UPI003358A238